LLRLNAGREKPEKSCRKTRPAIAGDGKHHPTTVNDFVAQISNSRRGHFLALIFAQRAFIAVEILALAAALSFFLLVGAAFLPLATCPPRPPMSRSIAFSKRSICCRIETARLRCWNDS